MLPLLDIMRLHQLCARRLKKKKEKERERKKKENLVQKQSLIIFQQKRVRMAGFTCVHIAL